MIPHARFARLTAIGLLITSLLCITRLGAAHPMGNFSINQFAALEVHPTHIRLHYVIDMAEIPTFQEMQAYGVLARPDAPTTVAYRERQGEALRHGLVLRADDRVLPLTLQTSDIAFPPGAGDLPTLRLTLVYQAPLTAESGELVYEDRNFPQRVGWKEIVASPQGGTRFVRSSVPAESKSQQLAEYATDLLQAPPQDLRATLAFVVPAEARSQEPPGPAARLTGTPTVPEAQTPRSRLTDLVTAHQLGPETILLALLVAMGLGALHALEPGHGKALVAAYLVGSRGTAWHACLLGLTVTASHTLGVFALGAVTLFASHYVVPEQLYPWLGLTSGLLIAGMGLTLLQRAWRYKHGALHDEPAPVSGAHQHAHAHPHSHAHAHPHGSGQHAHASHDHDHPPSRSGPGEPRAVSYGTLLTLGVTGGMIPCPGALVVLLSTVALQRIAFGMLLIVAFSIGLAAVLVATGLLLVSARGVVQRWSDGAAWLTYVPFLSPCVMIPLGILLAVQSLRGPGGLPGWPF